MDKNPNFMIVCLVKAMLSKNVFSRISAIFLVETTLDNSFISQNIFREKVWASRGHIFALVTSCWNICRTARPVNLKINGGTDIFSSVEHFQAAFFSP